MGEDSSRANSIKSRMERAWLPAGRTPSPTALGSYVKRSDSSVYAALESAATAAALAVSTDDSAKAKALDSRARALLRARCPSKPSDQTAAAQADAAPAVCRRAGRPREGQSPCACLASRGPAADEWGTAVDAV